MQGTDDQLSPQPTAAEREVIQVRGKTYAYKEDLQTVLFIGIDKREQTETENYFNQSQCDFLMLLVLDKQSETYHAIHINRDTMTEVPVLGVLGDVIGSEYEQIALAHTYGKADKNSCRNTVRAVSQLLYGIEIDHYASLSMDAIEIVNDAVGGVDVLIEDDFSKVDPTMQIGEVVHLQGKQAEYFVRGRFNVGDETNLNRMNRQRVYLTAIQERFHTMMAQDAGFAIELVLKLSDYLISDMTINQMGQLSECMDTFESLGIEDIKGEAILGEQYIEYYVDESALQEQVLRLFYDEVQTEE